MRLPAEPDQEHAPARSLGTARERSNRKHAQAGASPVTEYACTPQRLAPSAVVEAKLSRWPDLARARAKLDGELMHNHAPVSLQGAE